MRSNPCGGGSLARDDAFQPVSRTRVYGSHSYPQRVARTQFEKTFINAAELLDRKVAVIDPEEAEFRSVSVRRPAELIKDQGDIVVRNCLLFEERMIFGIKKAAIIGRHVVAFVTAIDDIKKGFSSLHRFVDVLLNPCRSSPRCMRSSFAATSVRNRARDRFRVYTSLRS